MHEDALGRGHRLIEGFGHDPYDICVTSGAPSPEVLLVVATLGRRPEYLHQTLTSIRDQDVRADVVLVAPLEGTCVPELAEEFGARTLPDPGSLPAAINLGVATYGADYAYVNWLNDDDLLEPGSLRATTEALKREPDAVVAFGACRYIDSRGVELWISRAGRWAPWILSWGPDLIPQPGMLVRTSAWHQAGGLDESYGLAFDLDLLLKLKKVGRLMDVGSVVSSFRWHADSLTVDDRTTNLKESERAKRAALSPLGRRLAWTWEGPVRLATRAAAYEVQRRARRASSR
jgi:GT2 family glycosyltransferase